MCTYIHIVFGGRYAQPHAYPVEIRLTDSVMPGLTALTTTFDKEPGKSFSDIPKSHNVSFFRKLYITRGENE